jgi:PAS domain S-box-containing protein
MRTENEKNLLIDAVDSLKHSVIVISPDCKILSFNHHPERSASVLRTGEFCYQALHGRHSPCPKCIVKQVVKTGRSARRRGLDGIMSLEKLSCLYAYPIFSKEKISSVAVLDFPMSTMEKMEERLHQSNAFLNNLIKSAVDGIIASDMTGEILIFNDAACDISGYEANEVIGKLDIRNIYPGDVAANIMKLLRSDEYGEKGTLRSFRTEIQKKTGEKIPISINAAIVYDGEKEVATLGFFHDLRETLEIEAELERTNAQLLQAEKMSSIGELAAGVAHQLNNPLSGITLFSQLVMEEYTLPEGAVKGLNRILDNANRCRSIVNELMTFARKTDNEIHPQDIKEILSQTLSLVEDQALFQNIKIHKDFDEPIPLVPVDVQKIKHVFMNIILNAADAMEGKGELSISCWVSPKKDKVFVEIADTGPGIPDDMLLKVFDPFFTTKAPGKGTGLGLSLAYRIVEEHGGKIYAESTVGSGTAFVIELLLSPPDMEGPGHGR